MNHVMNYSNSTPDKWFHLISYQQFTFNFNFLPSNSTFLAESWVHDHEFAKHDGKADGNTTESTITSPWLAAFVVE